MLPVRGGELQQAPRRSAPGKIRPPKLAFGGRQTALITIKI
jgi:hypothetical protein